MSHTCFFGLFGLFRPCGLYGLQRPKILAFSGTTKQTTSYEPIIKKWFHPSLHLGIYSGSSNSVQVCHKKSSRYSKPHCSRLLFISKWSKWVQKSRYCEEFHNKITLFEEFFWRIYIFALKITLLRGIHTIWIPFFALVIALFRGIRTIWIFLDQK